MANKPLISVITPSYNQRRFIEDTIQSLQRQTYSNFEHIVVDAGSTDGTLEVLKKHETAYNMTWSSEPDSGMYHGINKGLRRAKGQILAALIPEGQTLYLSKVKDEGIMFYYGRTVRRVPDFGQLPSSGEPLYCILNASERSAWLAPVGANLRQRESIQDPFSLCAFIGQPAVLCTETCTTTAQ